MNFPQFWARGRHGDFFAWRWSSKSLAEAQTAADLAAQALADRFAAGTLGRHPDHYYPNHPFREQLIQELKTASGETSALVTRNSYGCLVLNTAKVMFVDIDFPQPEPRSLLQRLFSSPPKPITVAPPELLALIERWTRDHSEWGFRIYQTRAGLRLLATHDFIEADSTAAKNVFAALGADPLYQKLCHSQKCYRARLTPKPWRCGIRNKPDRWPLLDDRAQKRFQKWEAHYQSFAFNWATCKLLKSVGNPRIHPDIAPIIALHDSSTKVASSLPLA